MNQISSESPPNAWVKPCSSEMAAAEAENGGERTHLARALGNVLTSITPHRTARYGDELLELVDRQISPAMIAGVIDPLKPTLSELRRIGKSLGCCPAQSTSLDQRLAWLCEELEFEEADKAILGVLARWAMFDSWRELVRTLPPWGLAPTATKLALLAGLPTGLVEQRVLPESRLLRSGLVRPRKDGEYEVAGLLRQILRSDAQNPTALVGLLVPETKTSSLEWDDFAHLGPLRELAEGILATKAPVSILLYGEPGTGKTEFARAVAHQSGSTGIFAGLQSDGDGEPDRRDRIAHLLLVRALCRHSRDGIVIVDEADDILAPRHPILASKQWVNLLTEEPKVPTIWILNDQTTLDPATLRRMTLAIHFQRMPSRVRQRIVRRAANAQCLALTDVEVQEIASVPANPAVVASGLRAAHLAGRGAGAARLAIHSIVKAMSQPCLPERNRNDVYDPALSSADIHLEHLVHRLGAAPAQGWSLLLAGPSGTGKSAFARHLAQSLDIMVHEHRASDLLGPFVGETESRIATAFMRAADHGAMLLIDEADSLLRRREAGQRSWEITLVNEMLQQMEHLHTPFIATTNFADQLDPAAQRRFTLRVTFQAMTPSQAIRLFEAQFGQSWPKAEPVPHGQTPGDLAVIAHRAALLGESRPEVLVGWLRDEITQRGDLSSTRVGFCLPEPVIPLTPLPSRVETPSPAGTCTAWK